MPLPADEKIVALSNQILQKFEAVFGAHPGFRPAHAKGIMLNGTFYAHTGSGFAQQGTPSEPAVHAGHGALLQLYRDSSDTGQ